MKTRLLVLFSVIIPLVLGTVATANSREVFYEIDLGRAAIAFWEDHDAETFAFVVAGQGLIHNSDVGRPLIGNVGCAGVGNATKGSFGCGELEAFSIDDDLGTASAKGVFDALIFDFETAKTLGGGTISLAVTWKASGDLMPRVQGGYYGEPSFLGVYTSAEVMRFATDGTKGRVAASGMGRAPSDLVDAATLAGPNVMFDLHG
jgi:hypothetical protein